MSERINDGNSNVIIVCILKNTEQQQLMNKYNDELTEYEFSPTSEEPVARMLGE